MEIWKTIKGFEDYQVSNLGNIKSLKFGKEKIIKKSLATGYYKVILCNSGKSKTIRVHSLVAETFLNHIPCGHNLVIDHIDDNKLNNNILNLQIISQRDNIYKNNTKVLNEYIGVYKKGSKFRAVFQKNKKYEHLGYFNTKIEAHNAYQERLFL